jgi:two-component system phosphate regulon sensor histidine kinase PhoR
MDKAGILSALPEKQLRAHVKEFAERAGVRITLVAPDGTVTADSFADAGMENHGGRPEIRKALEGEVAWSERANRTAQQSLLYLATPYAGGVIRLATPMAAVTEQVREIRRQVLQSTAMAIIPAALIALLFARYFSRKLAAIIGYAGQLARGNFHARLLKPGRDELGLLGQQLNEAGEKLQAMFEQLQLEHTELEKLERIRKDFVINVSHELRTPLASIQGYTETLLDGAIHDPEHNIRFLTIIRQNAERLARLTSDLLTLSRIELKTQKFQFALYYVNQLMQDDVDTMRPMADKKNIKIKMEPAPDQTEVFCDAEAVHQILANLLDNALKYTPEGGDIFVGARVLSVAHEQTPANVELYVRDTGTGIPAEELPRLFERFYRVDKARSRALGGTGLGLAIVKHLVRAQGGEVGVTSRLNDGSTFAFTLPIHDTGQPEEATIEPELTRSAS